MDIWDQCESVGAGSDYMDSFSSSSHAENPKGVDAELLQKIWIIDSDTAKRTINTTTQLNIQDINSKLSSNFGTNDKMLRYRRIKSFFFTDTLFLTKKAAISRGYICMQIFVSDMGYVYVTAMEKFSGFTRH